MATNPYKNTLPDPDDAPDIPAAFATFANSIGQWVPVTSRTEASQRLANVTGPFLVFRLDTRKFEVHPNTGASGEGWLVVSPPDEITSKDVIVKYTEPGGASDDYTIHSLFQEAFGKRQAVLSGTTEINLTSERPLTFDTGNVSLLPSFNLVPAITISPYISPAGQVVHARAVAVTTSSFQIRTTRPSGYNPGAVSFTWIAAGEVGGIWNGGQ